jgi:hypothetical protein
MNVPRRNAGRHTGLFSIRAGNALNSQASPDVGLNLPPCHGVPLKLNGKEGLTRGCVARPTQARILLRSLSPRCTMDANGTFLPSEYVRCSVAFGGKGDMASGRTGAFSKWKSTSQSASGDPGFDNVKSGGFHLAICSIWNGVAAYPGYGRRGSPDVRELLSAIATSQNAHQVDYVGSQHRVVNFCKCA